MDSATALYFAGQCVSSLAAVAFTYGQRHMVQELTAAQLLANEANVSLCVFELEPLRLWDARQSALLGSVDVESRPYPQDHEPATVVPGRNTLFTLLAAMYAVRLGAQGVVLGIHAVDAPYLDCRETFVVAMNNLLSTVGLPVRVYAPFVSYTKAEIVTVGASLGVPFGLTYSCYNGRVQHCGVCATCVQRRAAFLQADVPDPTVYEQ